MDYDVVIVGGGASGAALLYTLARYSSIPRILLIEKEKEAGCVNSHAKNNSQTLHVGDIETNYAFDKVRQVHTASMMVVRYVETLPQERQEHILFPLQKMVLGVGEREVAQLEERFGELHKIFPTLHKLRGPEIAEVEPKVMEGRRPNELMLALYNPEGYAVNFGLLAQSLVDEGVRLGGPRVTVEFEREVLKVEKEGEGYQITTNQGSVTTRVAVFDTDAYSLGFAKSMGLGLHFSLIPVAGSFYFSPQLLAGKVYRVQDPRMPFAAAHGDPDLTRTGQTRWGPTARFYPVLEARKLSTAPAYFRSSGLLRSATWVSFFSILLEPIRAWYLIKNFFYDLPLVGKYFFLPEVKRIVPTLKARDLAVARGYGGMRLQRVDTTTRELLLGEGKIIGENIIFNMTPSPGASVCLYNAMRDAGTVAEFFGQDVFEKERMTKDLCTEPVSVEDVSLRDTYPS